MENIRPMKVWTRRRAKFLLGIGESEGEIISENLATVRVKLPGGFVLKRHKVKHNVRIIEETGQ